MPEGVNSAGLGLSKSLTISKNWLACGLTLSHPWSYTKQPFYLGQDTVQNAYYNDKIQAAVSCGSRETQSLQHRASAHSGVTVNSSCFCMAQSIGNSNLNLYQGNSPKSHIFALHRLPMVSATTCLGCALPTSVLGVHSSKDFPCNSKRAD